MSMHSALSIVVLSAIFVLSKDIPPPPRHNGESHMMQRLYEHDVDRQINKWDPKRDKQNVWELSGLFEGDIMMPSASLESERNAVVDDSLRWHEATVPYHISDDFGESVLSSALYRASAFAPYSADERTHYPETHTPNDEEKEVIIAAMDEFHQKSCIKFRPYKDGDDAYVVVRGNQPGCWSYVGRRGGGQVVNLRGRCVQHGVAVHEFLHALGFHHQQSAADRDEFVKIHWQNIWPRTRGNFKKYSPSSVTDFDVGYDYDSVMHYSSHAFSKNGKETITPLEDGVSIGQRFGMSDKDAMKLNKMYNCDGGTQERIGSNIYWSPPQPFHSTRFSSFWDSPFDF